MLFSTVDRTVQVELRPVIDGLYVERTQQRHDGPHIVLSMLFATAAEFLGWCDQEPLRFEDPALHLRLRQRGEELFGVTR
jgi:hypothetical protein